MKPEQWQQINTLFHAALEREPNERAAFLAHACLGDERLRREVESLIASHEPSDSFIDSLAPDLAAGLLADRQARLVVGQSIGHYKVMALLGTGGMGEVYLTQDTRLGRRVALKLLPAEFTKEPDRLHRFEREARAASALNHPNIITIHEVGQEEGAPFIITEFIEGQTIRQQMAAKMTLHEAFDVAIQVASALGAAHKAGIVHRDIKPENIMLRPDGLVKVLDFGLAKLTEAQSHPLDTEATTLARVQTKTGLVMGTVTYMSPEQARGLAVDARSDIFSLGTLIYEMIAGRVPFDGATTSDVIVSILEREPAPLSRYATGVPAELQRIISKALRKDKDERYQSAKEVLNDLREVKRELELKSKLERSESLKQDRAETVIQLARASDEQATVDTADQAAVRTVSGVEYVVSEIKRHKLRAALIGAAFVLLFGSAGYGIYSLVSRPKSPIAPSQTIPVAPSQTMTVKRLTATGKARDAAFSPDGKYVVYAEQDAGQQSLWVRQVRTGSNVQIVPPAKVTYYGLTFSNDGDYVYYIRTEESHRIFVLYRVPSIGGASKKLIEDIDSCVAFSPDGQRFAFVRGSSSRNETSLMIANADGTGEQTIATRKSPDHFLDSGTVRIAWSPDGKIVACPAARIDANNRYFSVVGVSVEGGTEKLLSSQRWTFISQVAWLSDGSGLIMLAAAAGEGSLLPQLWHLSYPGGEARRITNDLNAYAGVSLTRDSDALITVQSNATSSVWVAPRGDIGRARQLTPVTDGIGSFSWTPDGRIVYRSKASGQGEIWIMDADGSNQKQLTYEGSSYWPTVSGDGRYIIFVSTRAGKNNIWRMDIDGGNPRQLTDGMANFTPHVSPDAQWVVYMSTDSGSPSLWKLLIDGGDPVQLTKDQTVLPVVSPDGKQIACVYFNDQANPTSGVAILPFEGGQPTKRLNISLNENAPFLHWSRDGRALLYSDLSNMWSQPVDGGKPTQLSDFQGDQLFCFDYSPEGKWLALARGRRMDDVVLIKDFR